MSTPLERMHQGRPPMPISTRFWSKVNVLGLGSDACWLWLGAKNAKGYGIFMTFRPRKLNPAHRVAWELRNGPIPEGLHLDHVCRTRDCVNPDHLRQASPRENVLAPGSLSASAVNAAKTHCPRGHEYDTKNTYRDKGGKRSCRQCSYARKMRAR